MGRIPERVFSESQDDNRLGCCQGVIHYLDNTHGRTGSGAVSFIDESDIAPTPIPAVKLQEILQHVATGIIVPRPKTLFTVGETVCVVEGPLATLWAWAKRYDQNGDALGRGQRVGPTHAGRTGLSLGCSSVTISPHPTEPPTSFNKGGKKEVAMSEQTGIGTFTVDSPLEVLSTEVTERIRTQPACHLLWAIMENGIEEYMRYATATSQRGKRLFREAEDWIRHDDPTSLCSFVSICHVLGVDPGYLRTGLRCWREQQSAARVFKHAA